YTITSTDTDDISTGMTSYSLSGTDAALFGIDSSTGEVTLLADPDYETQSSYCINVVAIDAAGNRSAETVILGINNIDEVAPSITSGNTATAIDENSGAGQVVYTITSTDTDDISTGMTSYSLSGTDAALFGIDSSTGEVTLLADPDYETQSSYCINVVAIDAAGNRSAETVILGINNIDEAILITPSFELFADTGSSGIDGITNDATVNVSDIGAGAIWQYSLDGGINWAAGISNSFELSADTTYGAGSIQVRGINSSGDVSEASQNYGVITVDNTAPLGSLVSTPFYLDTYFYTNTGVGRPQVSSVGSDGAYVVTWSVEYTDNILVQLFAADGTPSGDAVKLEGNNNTADNNFYPQVSAVGSDGAYVVTWYGKNSDGGYDKDYSNFVQLFAADGSTNGDVVELQVIGGTSYNDDYSGQVSAVGNDGTYVVTWVSHNGDYYDIDERVFVQLFAADGTVNGDAVQLETTSNTTGRASSSQVSGVGSDGAYVVIWSDRDSEGDNSIFVQLFTADGSISGDSLQLEAVGNTSGGDVLAQVSAVGSDGAYVVTWRGEDSEGDSSIFVQQFAVDGTLSGDSVQLEAVGNTTGSDSYPQVRAVGVDGAYVVTWSGEDSEGNTSIFVQQFAIDGSTDDDAVQLEATGNVYGSPQVSTVGSDGAYVVTWSGGSGVDDSSIFVQRFAANGSTVGEAVQLDSTGSDFTPQVSAVGNDGAYVVVWTGAGNGWDDYNILVQLFDAEGRPVVSTLLNDNQSIDVQSSEVGTAYLVSALIDVSSLHDITELDDTSYNSVAITSVDTATGLSSSGLADGTYFAYVADVAGNLSQIDQVIIIDSAANSDIEVFDLVSGQSSNLLTRTFEVEVSYDLSLTTESGKDSVSYDENLVLSEDDAINFVSDGSFNGELLGSDANVNFYATKFIEEEQTEFWLNTQNLVSDLNYINTHIVGGSLTSQGLA
ncbi:cadherin repeat domain-containing protein, partial [Paraglaciecola sp.]|uniref:cadherin repeat domain-containing protein n=2 Tax=Paraglaciecola sp. TaxID=1920173 RepID=UPI0032640A7C